MLAPSPEHLELIRTAHKNTLEFATELRYTHLSLVWNKDPTYSSCSFCTMVHRDTMFNWIVRDDITGQHWLWNLPLEPLACLYKAGVRSGPPTRV